MNRNIYEMAYGRILALLGCRPAELDHERSYRLTASGFMDLVVERLPDCEETGGVVLSLCHYVEVSGDLCQDPEMVVRVVEHPEMLTVEALTFQQFNPPVFERVYPEPGKVAPRLKNALNGFLRTWLRNLNDQGHTMAVASGKDTRSVGYAATPGILDRFAKRVTRSGEKLGFWRTDEDDRWVESQASGDVG